MLTLLAILAAVPPLAFAAAAPATGPAAGADLVLVGGSVHTLQDPEPQPAPTAIGMRGDRIVFVGDDAGARLLAARAGARVIELDGAVVVPGLCDAHAHLYGLGKALDTIDLTGALSAAAAAAQVAAAARGAPGDGWLEGWGWDQNRWPGREFPDRRPLDAVAPARPVILRRVDGHAAWVNGAALARAGITAATPDPAGGRIVRDATGGPTGILLDNAVELAAGAVPAPTPAARERRVRLAVAHCLERGLTGLHDAGADAATVAVCTQLAAAGDLGLRLQVMLADDPATLEPWLARGPWASPDGMLTVRAVKLYADGALGSRGALLLRDYADDPGNRGLAVTSAAQLEETARRAGRAGFQVCTHAIGDSANREVLDLYAKLAAELRLRDARWRIEHAQLLAPADIPRCGRLGVIASMQPVHCTSDLDWVAARVGEERAAGAYAWRALLDSGARLCFGTDAPVEAVDPLPGLYAARTRTHADGTPVGGWHPEQTVGPREALLLYTAGPAWAAFRERELGAVAPGYFADLTVLSGDPVAASPTELLHLRPLLTVVAGRVRWAAAGK
ncbi:MAG: amidohydrolase [Candidatus Krumholzibacteriia bacterium]